MKSLMMEKEIEVLNFIYEDKLIIDNLLNNINYDSVCSFLCLIMNFETIENNNENYFEQRIYIINNCFNNIISKNEEFVENSSIVISETV